MEQIKYFSPLRNRPSLHYTGFVQRFLYVSSLQLHCTVHVNKGNVGLDSLSCLSFSITTSHFIDCVRTKYFLHNDCYILLLRSLFNKIPTLTICF